MQIITISNLLTILRFILSPFIAKAIIHEEWRLALFLFIVAALSDVLDGYLARLWNEESFIGACLDPLADKCMVLSSFVALAFFRTDGFVIPLWFIIFFFMRELLIVVGAIYFALKGGSMGIKPTFWGKSTTFLQIVFILWLIMCSIKGWHPYKTYSFSLLFLVLFSLFSLLHYGTTTIKKTKKINS